MFCEHCGRQIPDGSTFCDYCGMPVGSDFEEYDFDTMQEPSGRPKWLLPVLFLALAAISVAGGIIVASITGDDDSDNKSQQTTAATVAEEPAEAEDDEEEVVQDTWDAEYRIYAAKGVGGGEGNTFYNFDAAIDQGAVCLEQDVVMSTDGTLFCHHNRVYNELPASAAVNDGLPTLEDVFERYGTSIVYVVEIKINSTDAADELIRLITDYGLEDNVIIQSFYPKVLRRVKAQYPDMTSIILHDDKLMNQVTFREAISLDCADMVAVNYDEGKMTEENCALAWEAGKKFAAWNLDSRKSLQEGIRMGVDAYFTKEPGLALELEQEYR